MTPLEQLVAQRREADEAIEAYRRAILVLEGAPRATDEEAERFVRASHIVDRVRPTLDKMIETARRLEALAASPTDGTIARSEVVELARRAFHTVQSACDDARARVLRIVAEPKESEKWRRSC